MLIKYLESDLKDSKIYSNLISLIFINKEQYFKKHNIKSCLEKSIYQVFQDKIIGKRDTPFLKFKMLEWNKELDFIYRPDIKNETNQESENKLQKKL